MALRRQKAVMQAGIGKAVTGVHGDTPATLRLYKPAIVLDALSRRISLHHFWCCGDRFSPDSTFMPQNRLARILMYFEGPTVTGIIIENYTEGLLTVAEAREIVEYMKREGSTTRKLPWSIT